MPNLIYYKDSSGVVRGPLAEEEATALLNANFFRPDHVFRSVDSQEAENFMSIDDLRSLNGAETPFGRNGEQKEEKELVRVYKELLTVLQERNALMVKQKTKDELMGKPRTYNAAEKVLIEQFQKAMKTANSFTFGIINTGNRATRFSNKSSTPVRCLIADSWNPLKSTIVQAASNADVEYSDYKHYIYIAPYVSDDPLDGSELVVTFRHPSAYSAALKFY